MSLHKILSPGSVSGGGGGGVGGRMLYTFSLAGVFVFILVLCSSEVVAYVKSA